MNHNYIHRPFFWCGTMCTLIWLIWLLWCWVVSFCLWGIVLESGVSGTLQSLSHVTVNATVAAAVRTNVVAEDPGLDVGPLVAVTVLKGDIARLPCNHPHPAGDNVSLVLWYLNHTSRPFFSYDARAETEHTNLVNDDKRADGRMMRLEGGGTSIVLTDVRPDDEAEYRCRVHFRFSPTWTQRLLLKVRGSMRNLVVMDMKSRTVIGGRVGPLAEGDNLLLLCRAKHGTAQVVNLVWLMDGREVDTSWAGVSEGVTENQLEIRNLKGSHHHAHIACRLTTHDPAHTHISANITDISVTIIMFRVPEARIIVEGGGHESRDGTGGWEVTEGERVTFLCSVAADPPAYNITFLHNGRVVGTVGRLWRRDNTSLMISPVTREDGGLYTCLASNNEGDGHSNAVLLRIAHRPRCAWGSAKRVLVAANSSLTLSCKMEALPENLTFTWSLQETLPSDDDVPGLADVRGGIITGDAPPPRHPGLIDLTPGHPQIQGLTPSPKEDQSGGPPPEVEGRILHHLVEAGSPTHSSVSLTPTAPANVFCYARNRVGHTMVPCSYIITIVDPPPPLSGCNVTAVGVTSIQVNCDDTTYTVQTHDRSETSRVHQAPGISFVRSSEVKTSANLEVWSEGSLVANRSEDRPIFTVQNLPPATNLQLVLYMVTPQARSLPLYLYTHTLPRVRFSPTAPSAVVPDEDSSFHDAIEYLGGVGGTVGGLMGATGCLVLLLTLLVVAIRWRQNQRSSVATVESGTSLNHPLDAQGGSCLHLDAPPSHPHGKPTVYCLNAAGGEEGDTIWLETSVTPLVVPSNPISPTDSQGPPMPNEETVNTGEL